MRLVTFLQQGRERLGALVGERVVDLAAASGGRVPETMVAYLAAGEPARIHSSAALVDPPDTAFLPLREAKLLAPVPRPGKIICLGLNYADHAAEQNAAVPADPVIFAKFATTVTGPRDPIVLPRVSEQVDYEAELAVVIGRRGKHLDEASARACIAGYTVANDVSVRDYQRKTPQWVLGKSFDTHCPMGPALVMTDEVPDPHILPIRCSINGEVLQEANTGQMIYRIPFLIAYLSQAMTLEPGDVILTGTPAGVGFAREPRRWIRPGDVVRTEIGGLGYLENLAVPET